MAAMGFQTISPVSRGYGTYELGVSFTFCMVFIELLSLYHHLDYINHHLDYINYHDGKAHPLCYFDCKITKKTDYNIFQIR